MTDFARAITMYRRGKSIAECAVGLGITRQSLWKSLRRRGVRFRSNLRFGRENHFFRRGRAVPGSRRAQHIVEKALQAARLIRPEKCEKCPAIKNLQAHHDDYNKPLKVRWLCKRCHWAWHEKHDAIPLRR